MKIEFDEQKRTQTLNERGLDFCDAKLIFAGNHFTLQDLRKEYYEPRFITVGWLAEHMILVVWTPREDARRIISMRKCNERERKMYEKNTHQK